MSDQDVLKLVTAAAAQQVLYQLEVGEDSDERRAMADAIADEVVDGRAGDMAAAVRVAIAAAFSLADNAGYGARRQASLSGRYDGAY